jgi:sugar lactone lactonase YvrE
VQPNRVSRPVLALLVFSSHAATQVITTVAGTTFVFPSQPLRAANAPLGSVNSIAIDTAGNVYASDADNNLVVQIAPDGALTVVAGNGTRGFSGDGGPATSAALSTPFGVAVDSAGDLYIADYGNGRIRKVSGGMITTFAGNGMPGFSGDGGSATNAEFNGASGVAIDSAGTVYIADIQNNRIRRVAGGIITTIAGTGVGGFSGDGGPATSASLYGPVDVAVDSAGNIYIADSFNSRVRKVSDGIITTIAGSAKGGFSGDGGPATNASLNTPYGITVDSVGNVYIADQNNYRIRKVSGGIITTIAGTGAEGFSGDGGPAASATLNVPTGVAVDSAGNVYIADQYNDRVREVSGGIISTVAGNGGFKFAGDGGIATGAALHGPSGVAADAAGALYIADTQNNRIRKVSGGIITTVAGGGLSGDGGPAIAAALSEPFGVAVDSAGNLYIVELIVGRIRKVSDGIITTVVGNATNGFSGDGGPAAAAAFNGPRGIAVDSAGNLYIADSGNNRIRKISGGIVTTVAGDGATGFSGDGGFATRKSGGRQLLRRYHYREP